MDIRQEIRKLVPAGALGLLGIERAEAEPLGDDDLTILFTDLDDHTAITDRLGDRLDRLLQRLPTMVSSAVLVRTR